VNSVTTLTGIIGFPLGHSLSPAIHNAAFRHLGIDWAYVPLLVTVSSLEPLFEVIRYSNFAGLNVTMPYKTAVVPYLDDVTEFASLAGAVNTIQVAQEELIGHNTDGGALVSALKDTGDEPLEKHCALIGAGGAARAVAAALCRAGLARLSIINRTPEAANVLRDVLRTRFHDLRVDCYSLEGDLREPVSTADIIVNATPLGMEPQPELLPIDPGLLEKHQIIADLIYRPPQTALLAAAQERGARTLSGVEIFLRQALESFEIWTGLRAPDGVMRAVLERELGLDEEGRQRGASYAAPGSADR